MWVFKNCVNSSKNQWLIFPLARLDKTNAFHLTEAFYLAIVESRW